MNFRRLLEWVLAMGVLVSAWAQPANPTLGREDVYGLKPKYHAANRLKANERDAAARRDFREDAERLVLPGVVADRRRRRVEVTVERSAVAAGSPCEFLIVAETSDHTYESLLIAFARPADVRRALEFIGLAAGQPSDPGTLRYWARGEAVRLRLEGVSSVAVAVAPETWLTDRRTGRPLPESRFLFTGSRTTRNAGGEEVLLADANQPQALAALFNTPAAVLEVAQRARKETVYQNTVVHPEAPAVDGLLTLVLEPLAASGQSRLRDLELLAESSANPPSASSAEAELLRSLRVQLRQGSETLLEPTDLPRLLERFAKLDREAFDWFLTVRFDDRLSLAQARALASVLALVDSERGLRIEPPPPQSLHYRAFLPERQWLDREERLLQPLELVLADAADTAGRLVFTRSRTQAGRSRAELETTSVVVQDPPSLRRAAEALLRQAREEGSRSDAPTLLVFAPSNLSVSQLAAWVNPLRASHPQVQVFLDASPGSLPRETSRK